MPRAQRHVVDSGSKANIIGGCTVDISLMPIRQKLYTQSHGRLSDKSGEIMGWCSGNAAYAHSELR